MKTIHVKTNIFDMPANHTEAVCITTNGMIKSFGRAVMGAGIAKEANNRYQLDHELANHLVKAGNVPCLFEKSGNNGCFLISFPTKHDWRDKSDISLIRRSAILLSELCDRHQITKCYLTPPGCGCGNLDWKDVEPAISDVLDDRFIILFRN